MPRFPLSKRAENMLPLHEMGEDEARDRFEKIRPKAEKLLKLIAPLASKSESSFATAPKVYDALAYALFDPILRKEPVNAFMKLQEAFRRAVMFLMSKNASAKLFLSKRADGPRSVGDKIELKGFSGMKFEVVDVVTDEEETYYKVKPVAQIYGVPADMVKEERHSEIKPLKGKARFFLSKRAEN